jgi:hypothetical protein
VTALERFQREGQISHLDECISNLRREVARTPPADPNRLRLTANLATTLFTRFAHGPADGRDLDEAIGLLERLRATPDGPDGLAELVRSHLAACYVARYTRALDATDLDNARALGSEQAAHDSLDIDILATIHLVDFYRTGNLLFLERMLRTQRDALRASAPGDRRRVPLLINMSRCYLTKSQALDGVRPDESRECVDRAVAAAEQAAFGASTVLEVATARATLGACLQQRAGTSSGAGHDEDRDRAIELLREAVSTAALDRTNQVMARQGLVSSLTLRGGRTNSVADLDEAAAELASLIGATPPMSLVHASFVTLKATTALARSRTTNDPADARAAARETRQAFHSLRITQPTSAFRIAREWGESAWGRRAFTEAAEAYGYALEAFHALAAEQVGRTDRQDTLRAAGDMAARAAYAHAQAGGAHAAEAAGAALESGRALLLSEVLERTSGQLRRLADTGQTELYRQYLDAVDAVSQRERKDLRAARAPGVPTADGDLTDLAAARSHLAVVVEQVREVPGFAWFLRTPTVGRLRAVTRSCGEPVVCLLATDYGGMALIYPPASGSAVTAVPLPQLIGADVEKAVKGLVHAIEADDDIAAESVVCWMWDAVMHPVLRALPRPRAGTGGIVLVPAGRLGMLPLHAAGRPDPARRTGWHYAIDDVDIRYSPTIRALADPRPWPAADDLKLLAVADPRPVPARRPLHMAPLEADLARCWFAPAHSQLLDGAAATGAAVRSALGTADVYHFACHATVDQRSPLDGGLDTVGDRVSVRDLLASRIGRGRLAVLSACRTAEYDATLPEEVIGMPTALMQSDVPAVIGSLWTVKDTATAVLMGRFYQLWRGDGLAPPAALCRAQRWLRDSTNDEVRSRFPQVMRVPSKNYAGWSGRLGHSGVLRWAGFAYFGT